MEGEQDSVCRAVVHNFEVAQNKDVERALATELDLNSSTEDPLSTGVVPFLKVLKIYKNKHTWWNTEYLALNYPLFSKA